MLHRMLVAGLLALAVAVVAVRADEKPKEVKTTHKWEGSVEDEKLQKEAPEGGVITDSKTFEKIWTAWKLGDKDKVEKIDFDKEIVVINTTVGSKLSVKPMLDDKGDLKALGLATRDLRPGFRYVVICVPREGVKTINGKELPKPKKEEKKEKD
jgi:hypothetical protein